MTGFVKPNCQLTVAEIAALTHAKLRDGDPADRRIGNIAPLDSAGPSDISFLDNSKYLDAFANTRAGTCLIAPRFAASAPRGPALLETPHPYPAFVAVTRKLFSEMLRPSSLFATKGRAASAQVHPTARLTTIDRGAMRDTVIGEGTKIGNLVQIGHNCSIGCHCLIVSQVGISGSVTIGDFAVLTGQVGIADHLTIGAGAVLGGRAGVMSNVPDGARWAGTAAEPAIDWKRGVVLLRRVRGRRNRSDKTGE